jgi:hypothetical protein
MLFLFSCQSSPDSSLRFYVGNFSRVQQQMDIKILVDDKPVFDSAINFATQPYGYTAETKVPKGNHTISVLADSARLKLLQPVSVKDNLWVYISYTFGSVSDTSFPKSSVKALPSLAAIDLAKPNPSVHIFISDSKPSTVKDSSFQKWAAAAVPQLDTLANRQ